MNEWISSPLGIFKIDQMMPFSSLKSSSGLAVQNGIQTRRLCGLAPAYFTDYLTAHSAAATASFSPFPTPSSCSHEGLSPVVILHGKIQLLPPRSQLQKDIVSEVPFLALWIT